MAHGSASGRPEGLLPLLLVACGGAILLWQAASISRLASRVERLESMQPASLPVTAERAVADTAWAVGAASRASGSPHEPPSGEPAGQRIDSIKAAQREVPAQQLAGDFGNLLSREPADPRREARQRQWLNEAARETASTSGGPSPEELITRCQGRRCMTSAFFDNEEAASKWATRYVLNAGGTLLPNSRTIVLPSGDGESVTVQIHFF